jgi:FAD/FMN-containing dehydrogenase
VPLGTSETFINGIILTPHSFSGVGYEELNVRLAPQGLFFPPDPGPGAKIGGMISQGCSGTNAYRYGTMKDWVLGLTMVLADGTVVKTRQRPRKSSAGYNLTQVRTILFHLLNSRTTANLDALNSSW